MKAVDALYQLSAYSIFAYSLLLLLLAVVGAAIFLNVIEVPEFHSK